MSDPDDDADEEEVYEPPAKRRMLHVDDLTEDEIETRIEMLLSGDRIEEFLVELERKIIVGATWRARRLWAKTEYNVDEETVNKVEALIRHGHRIQMIDHSSVFSKREDLRQKYLLIFHDTMEAGDYKNANKALDSLAKLDGLIGPDVHNNLNITVPGSTDVTSQTRDRIQQLFNRMRELAGGAQKRKEGLPSGGLLPLVSGTNGSGSNGGSKNGSAK